MKIHRSAALVVVLLLGACVADEPLAPRAGGPFTEALANTAMISTRGARRSLNTVNSRLERSGADHRVAAIEFVTDPASGQPGRTVYASDIQGEQGPFQFAPESMYGDGNLTYSVDMTEGAPTGGLTAAQTSAAIDAAMAHWNAQGCSELPIVRGPGGYDLGRAQYELGFGGSGLAVADINFAGWIEPAFFQAIPDGAANILAVTFTYVRWVDGLLVDSNGDGLWDVAFREVYFNAGFTWTDGAGPDGTFDAQTVALHEAGHGVGLAHIGTAHFRGRYGTDVRFSPRAVMNAVYGGVQRDLLGIDRSTYCSVWRSWE